MTDRLRPTLCVWYGLLLLLALAMAPHARAAEAGSPPWSALSPQQRSVLAPLAGDWAGIDTPRRQKWLEVAARFDQLSPVERERVQQRMGEWARLTPAERGQARLNFQGAKQLSVEDRQARWEAYQALPEEQRRRLAAQGKAPTPAAVAAATAKPTPRAGAASAAARPAIASPQPRPAMPPGATRPKVNTVPDPLAAAAPKPIGPTVVQAKPGASTRLITQKPTPQPDHQQTGMPKIAATPEFVDRKTLLPQRGPQKAGAASGPTQR